MYIFMYMYTYMYIHKYIYMYIHINIFIYIQSIVLGVSFNLNLHLNLFSMKIGKRDLKNEMNNCDLRTKKLQSMYVIYVYKKVDRHQPEVHQVQQTHD